MLIKKITPKPELLHLVLTGASSEWSGQSKSPSHCHWEFSRHRPSAQVNSPGRQRRYPAKTATSHLMGALTASTQNSADLRQHKEKNLLLHLEMQSVVFIYERLPAKRNQNSLMQHHKVMTKFTQK